MTLVGLGRLTSSVFLPPNLKDLSETKGLDGSVYKPLLSVQAPIHNESNVQNSKHFLYRNTFYTTGEWTGKCCGKIKASFFLEQ